MTLLTVPIQRDTNIPETIKLPPLTPDQIAYLENIMESAEYDPTAPLFPKRGGTDE